MHTLADSSAVIMSQQLSLVTSNEKKGMSLRNCSN